MGTDVYFFGPDISDMASTLLCANAAAIHLITLAVENMGLVEFGPASLAETSATE